MKLIDFYNKGLILAGQQENQQMVLNGEEHDRLFFINLALADLELKPATDIFEEREFSVKVADALIYGIAYLLSVHCGFYSTCAFIAKIYNGKRASVLNKSSKIKDTFSNL
ncbi:MAG: hypothetical protein E7568_02020 [Ruminococcaceae bacterium]|nr:hypothetical protein [Oscillospiraceae bacterium]